MDKETMISAINSKFAELKNALEGDSLETIRELALDLHAMVHPSEISGRNGFGQSSVCYKRSGREL